MVTRRGREGEADSRIKAGSLRLSPQSYELSREGGKRSVRLGAKEYQLMEYLMRNPGQVLSREQITQRVWGYDSETEYNNVDVYVSFIRKKLKFLQTSAEIQSIRGVGYRLEAGND